MGGGYGDQRGEPPHPYRLVEGITQDPMEERSLRDPDPTTTTTTKKMTESPIPTGTEVRIKDGSGWTDGKVKRMKRDGRYVIKYSDPRVPTD